MPVYRDSSGHFTATPPTPKARPLVYQRAPAGQGTCRWSVWNRKKQAKLQAAGGMKPAKPTPSPAPSPAPAPLHPPGPPVAVPGPTIGAGNGNARRQGSTFLPAAGADPNREIVVALVLDASGSMSSKQEQVRSGANEHLAALRYLREQEGLTNLRFFLTQFDDTVTLRRTGDRNLLQLTPEEYRIGGMTALRDAVGRTIESIQQTCPNAESVLVVTFTDGLENQSRFYIQSEIRSKVRKLTATGRWTFALAGVAKDTERAAAELGIETTNAETYDNSRVGTQSVMTASTNAMTGVVRTAAAGQSMSTNQYWGAGRKPSSLKAVR